MKRTFFKDVLVVAFFTVVGIATLAGLVAWVIIEPLSMVAVLGGFGLLWALIEACVYAMVNWF